MKTLLKATIAILFVAISNFGWTQCSQALWQNPSFEGPQPAQAHVLPPSWNNCNGTTSDTQPGNWGVTLPPTNGSTYIGLVAVPGWQETASQYLSTCLTAGVTYTFTFDMTTFDEQSTPGVCDGYLYLWAGSLTQGGSACDFDELVWQSPLLAGNTNTWANQTVSFTPTQNWCSLTFQAIDFNCPTGSFYVLLDNLSPVNPLALTPTQTNATCAGNDGTATVTVAGGVNPITYVWTPNVSSTNTASNLAPGNYSVTVTDGNSCTGTQNFTITGTTTISASITNPSPVICAGQSVTLSGTSGGGSGALTYNWSPGGQTTTNVTVTPMTTTLYTYTVTDATGCTGFDTTTIIVNSTITVNAGPDQNICTGATTTLTASGALNYSWSDGVSVIGTTASINVTPAVTTTYYVTGDAGSSCIDIDTVIVAVGNNPDPTITPAGPFCSTDPIVTLTAASPGGVWSATCVTCINAATGQFDPSLATTGNNTITYTFSGSCGAVDTEVIQIESITLGSVTDIDVDCFGNCNGSISMSATGATQFSSDNGVTFQPGGNFNSLCPGTYNLVAETAIGCQVTSTATITEPTALTLPTSFIDVSCFGTCDGSAIVAPQGGTAPYSYSWSSGGGNIPAINNLCANTYTVTVTDGNGCSANATIVVSGPPAVTVDNTSSTPETCPGDCDGTVTVNATNATQYSIDGGVTFQGTNTFSNLCTGNYNIVIEDINGCQDNGTASVANPLAVNAQFVFNPQPTNLYNTEITFLNLSSNAITYTWDFAGLGTSNSINPVFTFPDTIPGQYDVCLYAADLNGCLDSTCNVVIIDDILLVYVPNAFTPDGDGINDYFIPVVNALDPEKYELFVFNRWGEIIFNTESITTGWDGSHKGIKSKQDVYVWKIVAKDLIEGKKRIYYGHVSLLR